ncbi:DUF4838 domain-containing protein [Paenibacillus sp. LMG 31460]|uniref:DUF4838 domain-containing protein n=1 Tax=Paenibacillus germinis TaxID=2654979 RepID=A0ABX1ZCC6_9BACL|nr:DUF4838 domain-containing protein [Paenibacillus germinis]NOU90986.1 DUF4838 domain-containing protein [Paenibacillus germinis]
MILTIYVNKGPFDSALEAAYSEQQVDWWDDTDERAVYCTECFAAVELQKHLQTLLGDHTVVRIENTEREWAHGKDRSNSIFIGTLLSNPYIRAFEAEGLVRGHELNDENGEAFLIETLQSDGEKYWVLSGVGSIGSLYAVYTFLEKLGFHWYAPGETGVITPEPLSLLPEIRCQERPSFRTRGCYSEFIDDRNADLFDWMARNRMNYAHLFTIKNPHALKKRGIRIAGGGHDILYKYLDPLNPYPYAHPLFGGDGKPQDPYPVSLEYKGDTDGDGILAYAESHPEWFALVDGERSYYRSPEALKEQYFAGDNHCLTHPDASDELAKNIINALVDGDLKHVDDLNFWLLDNGNWCSCDRCSSSGNYTSRLILLVHHLRQKLCQAMAEGILKRNVRILFPAYHETLEAPDRPLPESFDYHNCFAIFFPIERCYVHTFNNKGCTETNLQLLHNYESWTVNTNRHFQGEMFIGEYYGVRTFAAMPILLSSIIANDIPYYYETGARHFYYMHITSGRWGMLALNNYLYAALLWNAKADTRANMDTYFEQYYCEAAGLMKSFYEKLEVALSNIKYLKHYQEIDGEKHSLWLKIKDREENLFPSEHMKYEATGENDNSGISLVATVEQLHACRAILDAALFKAEKSIVAQRLLEDEMRFDYGHTMIMFYYRVVRTVTLLQADKSQLARAEFAHCQLFAEKLRASKLPLDNYDYSKYYDSGLDATWIKAYYEQLLTEFID